MKKKLLLLLLYLTGISMVGQNPTRFPYGVQIKGGQTATSTTSKIISQETDGTLNTIDAVNFPVSTATTNALELKSNKDSGLLSGGTISVNADPTKWNLAEGAGYITNSLTGVVTPVTWAAQNALTTPYLATSVATYVLIDSSGGTVLQNTAPTQQQYRTHIYLGKLAHTTFTTILFAVSEPSRMFDVAGQVSDLNRFLGSGNVDGNVISANGANLNINASAGMTYRAGANYSTDRNSPSITTEPIFTAGTFRNKFRNGSGGWSAVNTSVIDPNYYDNGSGILQVVPNNKWTVKVLWRFGGTGTIHCDYGQVVYDNKVDALAAAGRSAVAEDPETKRDASRRAWLVVQQGSTVLNDLTKAEFIPADKLGERSSGSSSTATFQTTYNNSVTPQITTTVGGGALAIKQGSGSDTDNILVGQNGSGTNTFSVTGNGELTGGAHNFIRAFDGNPAARLGYEDTGFNFSVSAGGGGSYLTFRQQAAEVARFGVATGAFMVGQTTGETAGYKLLVNGKGSISGNLYSPNFTDLAAKRWYIFGDSFSNGLDGSDYVTNVVNNLDLVAVTYAVAGHTSSEQLAVLKAQLAANPLWLTDIDIISLHIGVNDQYSGAVALGNVNSAIGSGSISANIKEFIELAAARNPKIRIFIITPPEADGGTSGRVYKGVNALGWGLEALSTTISNICKYYSVQCVDLYSLSQFNLQTIPTMTSDGLHPSNPQGLKQLGDIVSRAFVSNNSAGVSVVNDKVTTGYLPYKAANNSYSNSRIYSSGTFTGIGTTTPSTELDVNGIVNSNSRYVLNNGIKTNQFFGAGNFFTSSDSNNVGIRNDSGKILFAAGAATEDVTIETDGRLITTNNITTIAGTTANHVVIKSQLDLKSNLASPAFTGTPTAPTPTTSTGIANKEYVDNAVSAVSEPYLVYTAILNQSGTSDPTATVLRNTLGGTVVWTRSSAGVYLGTLSGAFNNSKTVCFVTGGTNVGTMYATPSVSTDSVQVVKRDEPTNTGTDDLGRVSFEIRVYP